MEECFVLQCTRSVLFFFFLSFLSFLSFFFKIMNGLRVEYCTVCMMSRRRKSVLVVVQKYVRCCFTEVLCIIVLYSTVGNDSDTPRANFYRG